MRRCRALQCGGHLRRGSKGVKDATPPCSNAPRRLDGCQIPRCRDPAMPELFAFISYLLQLYIYILIAAAVLSWLVAFNVVNVRNPIVAAIGEFLYRITEPVLRPIRNALPSMGGIDISPVIVILIIILI